MQKRYGTRDSEVIPDLRTNRAWRRLACKFEMGLRASDCTLAVSNPHFFFSNSHTLHLSHLNGDNFNILYPSSTIIIVSSALLLSVTAEFPISQLLRFQFSVFFFPILFQTLLHTLFLLHINAAVFIINTAHLMSSRCVH